MIPLRLEQNLMKQETPTTDVVLKCSRVSQQMLKQDFSLKLLNKEARPVHIC